MKLLLSLLFCWLARADCITFTLHPEHIKRWKDGDTGVLWSVGVPAEEVFRLLHVDTPERGQPLWREATAYSAAWVARDTSTFRACRRDSFGRILVDLTRNADTLAVSLINAGLGTRYDP